MILKLTLEVKRLSRVYKVVASNIGMLFIGLIFAFQAQAGNQADAFYGPTKQYESLWHIANATKPNSDISTQQMTLAIFKANPHAFKNNINKLYTGVRLRIPSIEEIKNITSREANQTIHKHNQEWLQPKITFAPTQILQQEISALTEKINTIKEDTEHRLSELEADSLSLEQRIVAMADRVNVLIEDVALHNTSINKLLGIINDELKEIDSSLSETIIASIVVMLFVLITYLTFSLFRKPKVKATPITEESDEDLEDEYDFINSTEGIPAKIDLARAYIDMDNSESALNILEEVISKGNEQQQKIAQALINKIRTPQSA